MNQDQKVNQAFSAWQEQRACLQAHSQQLEAALGAYASGAGPEPTELRQQVDALRKECDALFSAVLAAVTERAAGGP